MEFLELPNVLLFPSRLSLNAALEAENHAFIDTKSTV